MTFRWKTISGLLIVACFGWGGAILFQRPPAAGTSPAAEAGSDAQSRSAARGRIVPLVVDEQAPLAFVPAAPAEPEDGWVPRRALTSLPTIRASAESTADAPELARDFPRLEDLAAPSPEVDHHVDRDSAHAEVKLFTPIPTPIIASKLVILAPIQHKIVDGDTLEAVAERYLGDASRATEIYEQNREQLSSPDLLPLGVELTIKP